MLRLFLVIDDYNELIYLQTLLKKLGFDVEGLQNTRKYQDMSLGFNPHILITTARGLKVDGLNLAQGIIKKRGLPRIIALKTNDQKFTKEELNKAGVDHLQESPISVRELIVNIADLGGLDEEVLFEKYTKIKGFEQLVEEKNQVITFDENGQPIDEVHKLRSAIEALKEKKQDPIQTSSAQFTFTEKKAPVPSIPVPTPEQSKVRTERFTKSMQATGKLPDKNFDRSRIRDFNKIIRSAPAPEDIEDVEDERKRFVKALFKNKPK